jgi:hypothetical protein
MDVVNPAGDSPDDVIRQAESPEFRRELLCPYALPLSAHDHIVVFENEHPCAQFAIKQLHFLGNVPGGT